jgi:hypothetical protein
MTFTVITFSRSAIHRSRNFLAARAERRALVYIFIFVLVFSTLYSIAALQFLKYPLLGCKTVREWVKKHEGSAGSGFWLENSRARVDPNLISRVRGSFSRLMLFPCVLDSVPLVCITK